MSSIIVFLDEMPSNAPLTQRNLGWHKAKTIGDRPKGRLGAAAGFPLPQVSLYPGHEGVELHVSSQAFGP